MRAKCPIGTAFAFCAESGLDPTLKARTCELSRTRDVRIFTDPAASPTGFPFKVLDLPGTLSEPDTYAAHPRRCDLGYLREIYTRPDGALGYRCPAEPEEDFTAKNGAPADTCGRKCLCNGLLATIGLAQRAPGQDEPALITAGHDINLISKYLESGATNYTAADVIRHTLACQSND